MQQNPIIPEQAQELAYRESDGIEVRLLWSPMDGRVTVVVSDSRLEDEFELAVQPDQALDAFDHPYAYAAFHGVEYTPATPREPVYA